MRKKMASIMGEVQREPVLTHTVVVLLSAAGYSVIKPRKTEPYTTSQPIILFSGDPDKARRGPCLSLSCFSTLPPSTRTVTNSM